MRIWFNRINESRRSVVEVSSSSICFGRDASCDVVLSSPLVSRKHAMLRSVGDRFVLENVGVNSCLVGDEELSAGQSIEFDARQKIRIWPFTISLESEQVATIGRAEVEGHLRKTVADLELSIHKKLLERLDLYELESTHGQSHDSIMLLENNIEDVCREMRVFDPANAALLDEITGLSMRDHTINQLILETGEEDQIFDLATLTSNEFDVPATLVPEREQELHSLLQYVREKLKLNDLPDISTRVHRVESDFDGIFHLIRAHLHDELRKYLILRMLKKDLKDIVFGFGPLQDLLRAPTISEIMVVRSDQIYVERDGIIEKSGRRFISEKVTESIIERIVAQVGRRIDRSQPLVDARLPDGSRVNAIIPPLALFGPCLTVRKFPMQRLTMERLIELGTITTAAARFISASVIDRRSILISGGTGSGKTTLLNVVSSFIPYKERIVTIEDTAELKLHQEHVAALESKPANIEGSGEYNIRDLVKNALRMRPDRIIVGECRGGEAMDMVQAMNTGHDGSMTTVHANSAAEVIQRLELLMLMGADLPIASIHRQVASAIDLIVHIDRLPNGKRVVGQIAEVTGIHPQTGHVMLSDIFNRRNETSLEPTGRLPSFIDSLVAKDLLSLEFLYGDQMRTPSDHMSVMRGRSQNVMRGHAGNSGGANAHPGIRMPGTHSPRQSDDKNISQAQPATQDTAGKEPVEDTRRIVRSAPGTLPPAAIDGTDQLETREVKLQDSTQNGEQSRGLASQDMADASDSSGAVRVPRPSGNRLSRAGNGGDLDESGMGTPKEHEESSRATKDRRGNQWS